MRGGACNQPRRFQFTGAALTIHHSPFTSHVSLLPSAFSPQGSRRLITRRIYHQIAKSDRPKRFPDLSF
jgi:hypothetical protein